MGEEGIEKYLNKIICGDCREVLKELPENSIDAIVTDPPYGLGFMGKEWDKFAPSDTNIKGFQDFTYQWATECFRVLKPGGHLLSFGATRTYHRMACAIEDAGFEIRDCLMWVYGSGFPKSLNIGMAVDRLRGNERTVVGEKRAGMETGKSFGMLQSEGTNSSKDTPQKVVLTKGNSEWEGWGTALKPAVEPIVVARKPLSEKMSL